ncbi:hypothetical protein L484_010502 [Morus notabilis]|uniref:Uncharacterized protein n=1 Tax=Morus notabilis TaxID=981085 RepID=W9QPW6_9ROSA|nr:hypothetical protein L484_010502 [Morus notabilis]
MEDRNLVGKKRFKDGPSIGALFMHADVVDMWLMAVGFIADSFDRLSDRIRLLFARQIVNSNGNASNNFDVNVLQHNLNKVPDFVSKVSTVIGGYVVAFMMLWQLTMTVHGIASNNSCLVEWKISNGLSVLMERQERSFLGLNRSIKLGLRQGLIKGVAAGSNAFVYATWALMAYYGSRFVMYHGAQGGTIYATGVAIVTGGL